MNELKVYDFRGQKVTDSRVAEMIGVQHKNLLQKIKGYEEILLSSKFSSVEF